MLAADKAAELPAREPVYPLTEGMTNKRLRELAALALGGAPELPEWIEPEALPRARHGGRGAAVADSHRDPAARDSRRRSPMTRSSLTNCALLLLRQDQRRKRGVPLAGDGRLTAALQLPYELTSAQRRVIEEIRGDMSQSAPMLRLLQGDVGSGKTLVALMAMLAAIRSGHRRRCSRRPRSSRASIMLHSFVSSIILVFAWRS